MDIISIIIFIGIIQGILLGILLLTLNRGNRLANRLLGALMILIAFSISGFLLLRTSTYTSVPHLISLPPKVLFLFGPLFYFYVRALTEKKFVFLTKHLLHAVPFLLLIIYSSPFLLGSAASKLESLENISRRDEGLIILVFQTIHLFIYLYFIKKLIKRHINKIKTTMSSIDKINLRWINIGINLFTMTFTALFIFLILFFAGINLYSYYLLILPLMVSIFILLMGYLGLQQPIIFAPEEENIKAKKYERSTLTDDRADGHLKVLLDFMIKEKPYLDSNLTIQKLAGSLSIHPHHLSQIINEKMNQNFFDFINSYRIEEAQKLLLDPKGELLTILAIGEEVGFNSKSAFNTAFKKYTNMTPTQYKKLTLKK